MAASHEHEHDREPLDDAALEQALDGAFAAAADEAANGDLEGSPSVLRELRGGVAPRLLLRELEPAAGTPPTEPLGPDDVRDAEAGKYVVEGLLGRGGIGVVHRGHDRELGRDVAMKFLRTDFQNEPAVLHRFVEEAQIGGQLQHPGIVPVYDLGLSAGRPFFTMKLVRGQTLAQRLAERASPATDRRTLLAIFEDVCQTMAYAHARGVVHRDLKPANVMIGSFGEVQVVDWGMGKVLPHGASEEPLSDGRPDTGRHGVVETVRSSGHWTKSVLGTVMGTPAYMPPEQARGDVDQMDERSDVFALGAMLCEILTGQPPYVGGDQSELLGMAAVANLDDARERLRSCGAEAELVELAEQCLMPEPSARPRSAGFVARAAHDYLATVEARVHDARVAAAKATVRATALKRNQQLVIALTTAFSLGLAASLWFWRSAVDARADEAAAGTAAEANLANFNRLSYVVRLEAAKAKQNTLYPAVPDKAAAMRAWLREDAATLRDALPELGATIAVLEARALQQSAPESDATRRSQRSVAGAADPFLLRTLRRLVTDIESFAASEVLDVEQRLAWAERVEELSITRHRERWDDARLAIGRADGVTASELYAEVPIELAPQLGLVPIGANPKTKLWEFYHLRSAWDPATGSDAAALTIPTYGADGKLDVSGRGLVFVLIPGGSFRMGAQRGDENAPNFDASAVPDEESPVREIELAPYFLSKYEMTQGQWARLSGGEYPSGYKLGNNYNGIPVPIGDSHPVEQVSWTMCDERLLRHGLVLPTEAQWERGCRAGTSTPWFTGDEPVSLAGFANVLDRTGQNVPPEWRGGEAFDDGFKGPAPVGTFDSNKLGLFDVHGNVMEWCRDWHGPYTLTAKPGDGLSSADASSGNRVYRGGTFQASARYARAAVRYPRASTFAGPFLGVRPAREIR